MPNPFTRLPANRGQAPTERVQSIPEHEAEERDNIPYLGNVDHGVEPLKEHFNAELIPDTASSEARYEPEEEVSAIPVRIVKTDSSADTRLRWRSLNMPVPAQGNPPLRILSRNEQRTKAIIENTDKSTAIYVSDLPDPYGYASAILAPGGRLEFSHTEEVYVSSVPISSPGGWINLVPRQTINGQTTVSSPKIPAKNFSQVRLLLKVYSVTGATKSVTGFLGQVDQTGALVSGNALVGTGSLAVATSVSATYSPLYQDYVIGFIATGSASADQVTDSELWGYFAPDNSGLPAPIVSVMQEYYVTLD